MGFTDEIILDWKELCSLAAEYELKLRLLANKCREQNGTYVGHPWEMNLQDVEKWFCEKFREKLSSEDKKIIEEDKVRKLRNKIMHADFPEVIQILKNLKKEPEKTVTVFEINVDEKGEPYSTSPDKRDLLSWLWDCHNQGLFRVVKYKFEQAVSMVDRMFGNDVQ